MPSPPSPPPPCPPPSPPGVGRFLSELLQHHAAERIDRIYGDKSGNPCGQQPTVSSALSAVHTALRSRCMCVSAVCVPAVGLCTVGHCRSSGDVAHEAEVLLLQARLALLAQHNEDAVKLSQVTCQGGVQFHPC